MENENEKTSTNYVQTDMSSVVGNISFDNIGYQNVLTAEGSKISAGTGVFNNLYINGSLHVASNNGTTAKLRIILNLVLKGHIDSNVKFKNTINLYGFEIDEKIIKDVFTKLTEKHITVDEALVLMNYNEKDKVDTYKPSPYVPMPFIPNAPAYPYNTPPTAKPIEIHYQDIIKTPKVEWLYGGSTQTAGKVGTSCDIGVSHTTSESDKFNGTPEATFYNSSNRE